MEWNGMEWNGMEYFQLEGTYSDHLVRFHNIYPGFMTLCRSLSTWIKSPEDKKMKFSFPSVCSRKPSPAGRAGGPLAASVCFNQQVSGKTGMPHQTQAGRRSKQSFKGFLELLQTLSLSVPTVRQPAVSERLQQVLRSHSQALCIPQTARL